MKRGSHLRRTPLARGSKPLARASKPMARGKRLRKIGARAKRSADARRWFRIATLMRNGPYCARCGLREWRGEPLELDAHHAVPRARAPGWPRLHDPEIQGIAVCRRCHDALTLDPHDYGILGLCRTRIERAFAQFEAWRSSGSKR